MFKLSPSRATSGRFVTTERRGESSREPQEGVFLPGLASSKSIQLPEFFIDLPALCGSGLDIGGFDESVQRNPPANMDCSCSMIDKDRYSSHPIWYESWYLSLVVHTTNNEDSCLWQQIHSKNHEPQAIFGEPTHPPITTSPLSSSEAFKTGSNDLPSPTLIDQLVQEYFNTFNSFCPIIERQQFIESIKAGNASSVLLRCVLFISSIHCDLETIYRLGYKKRIEAEDYLFNKARAAFDSDLGSDRLAMLQSCYLLHYWSGKPSTYKDSLWWLAGAIRSAQAMGMHRTVERRPIHPSQRSIWRRTWWLLYIRDRQISISLGKPMIICDDDCDVELLRESDFADESPETKMYILAQAQLSISVSGFLRSYLSPSSRRKQLDEPCIFTIIGTMFTEWYRQLPAQMQHHMQTCSPLVFILNMTYYYYEIILYQMMLRHFRSLSSNSIQKSNDVITSASQSITTLVENALAFSETRFFPMICVSAIFAATTAQYAQSCRSSLSQMERQILLQSVKYNILAMKEFEQCHILAHWIRQLFIDALRDQPMSHPSTSVPEGKTQQPNLGPDFSPYGELQVRNGAAMYSASLPTTLCDVPPADAGTISSEGSSGFCDSNVATQGSSEDPGTVSSQNYDFYSFEQLQYNLFDHTNYSNFPRVEEDWNQI